MKKKDFAEAGALYFIATLFNKGIGFVTVPIFSRILTTSDYGTVTTFNSWVSMISVFISLALYNAVRNSFVDMDDKERPHFLSTIITFTGLVFLTVMGVCVVATVFVPRNINTALIFMCSLVYNLSMIATVITTSLDGIWVPWFTGKLKERKIREINVLAMDYVHLMTYAMVALILVGPEILKIFADQRYWEGMSIIPPIALANYMIFMYTMYVYIEHYYKKTVYITKNTLIAAGLNVILNFILIPKYGYVAAAYTTLASYFVAFILHSRYAKKIEPDIYPLKMFALPLLHVGGAIILYYPLLNFWTLRWGILFVYLIIVLIKERFRIGTLVPVLAEKCSFFKEK